jgi:hypothetical protein
MAEISNKAFREVTRLISDVISLHNVEEFEEDDRLFENPPDCWSEEEKRICDYQARIKNEILAGIEKIFSRRK